MDHPCSLSIATSEVLEPRGEPAPVPGFEVEWKDQGTNPCSASHSLCIFKQETLASQTPVSLGKYRYS